MNSNYPEYHTHDYIRNFIFSEWSFFGIKARYVKVLIIVAIFFAAIAIKQLLVPELHNSPFLLMYVVVIIGTLLTGFKGGAIVTVLTMLAVLIRHAVWGEEPLDMRAVYGFFIQGVLYSFLIGAILRILKRLRRQADLLALSNEAIIVRDLEDNSIIFWNFGAQNMYNYSRSEVLGKDSYKLLQAKSSIPLNDIKKIVMSKGEWRGEMIHLKKNNKPIIVRSTWVLKKNEDRKESDVIVELNTDITTRKTLEKRRDEFLSIASHELKTPVTSLKAFTQILRSRFKKIGDKTSESYLGKMETQLNRLTNLVTDLLDSTKIQAGKLQLNINDFKLTDLLDEVIENIQLTTVTHKIVRSGSTKKMVRADRDRTEQVLINLINNAIKYSPKSHKVTIQVEELEDSIKIGVQDKGIGIAKNKLKRIFDRFYRVESKEGEFSGLGLGLYISSAIVKRQSGKMWVESEENGGSTFYFTLPKKIDE